MYTEIRNDYATGPLYGDCSHEDEGYGKILIDGWEDNKEEGSVIASVIISKAGEIIVDWHDNGARMNDSVLEAINEAKQRLAADFQEEKERKENSIFRINKISEEAILPTRSTDGSAGYDLYVCTDKTIRIWPGDRVMLSTGIRMAIPKGYFGAVYARSGLAVKYGLRPVTCVSVIDADYRDELFVPLVNEGDRVVDIQPGARIAQIVFQKYHVFDMIEQTEWNKDTARYGGFGSTGM